MSEEARPRSLIVLGFDAGDPKWMQQWAAEGRLPTVARIMKDGCWGQTAGPELLFEHGVWQTILSGMSRAQTGHYYFRQLKRETYDLQLVNGADIDPRPFWKDLTRHRRILVADVPDVLPSAAINGAQIANWAVHRGWRSHDPAEQPITHPPELLQQLGEVVGPPQLIVENAQATTHEDQEMYQQLLARVARKGALCREMIRKEKPNLAVMIFGESHSAGHQFWKYGKDESAVPNGTPEELRNATQSIYEAIDHEMGALLRELPADSDVVILSSVGLTDHYPTGRLLESFCTQLGYQVPRNGGSSSFSPMMLLRQLVPERWRIAVSRNFTRERRERLLAEQFRSATDWSRTTAFVIPSIYTGFIQVNLRGREPLGVVEPGDQYESLLRQIESDLARLIDPITGEAAIEKVIRTADVFGTDSMRVMPDLIVHWKPSAHLVERVIHPRCELFQSRPEFNRASDHYEHGFFAAAGPSIAKSGRLADINALDLAPTFLRLLGEAAPGWMRGRPLPDVRRP